MTQTGQDQTRRQIITGIIGGIIGVAVTVGLFVAIVAFRSSNITTNMRSWIDQQMNQITTDTNSSTTTVAAVDVSDVVEKANPAVVSIIITRDVPVIQQYYEEPFKNLFGGNSPFKLRIPRYRQTGTKTQQVGGGSGFFVSKDGYLVTNGHVVAESDAAYTVFAIDGKEQKASIIAVDKVLDIALLKVDVQDVPFLEFGDSNALRLGQSVIAIGNALGEFRNTVSVGVVSGLSRSITAGGAVSGQSETLENVIQTDAAINPGNSGGPLIDLNGKVVGVNVAVALGSENVGFSLPANSVKASVDSILANGRVMRPYLGIRYTAVTPAIKEQYKLTVDQGALILPGPQQGQVAVVSGSPADKAGLKEGNVILEMDGVKIDIQHSLASLLQQKKVGDQVKLKVLQDGTEKEVLVTLEEMPVS
ncbi:MAG TPA: trypsin-like peptidase domain-containing protein [Patescibacteria group bacterium]|nr:trypsin-like peptidase domain-containing protein [Patescibacteria group bacterium]